MNKRIMKKLCKRAAPLLPLLGDNRQMFSVSHDIEPDAWSDKGFDRKHIDRWGGKPNDYGYYSALDGTIGVGSMSCGEEPEWSDQPAYQALVWHMIDVLVDWESFDCDSGEYPEPTVKLKNPHIVFREAAKYVRIQEGE